MDVLTSSQRHGRRNTHRNKKGGGGGVKVVYISSPMKVTTSASKFRALVQELTGRDSDVAGFMAAESSQSSNGAAGARFCSVSDHKLCSRVKVDTVGGGGAGVFAGEGGSRRESPASSDSVFESSLYEHDCGFMSQVEESFAGIFPSCGFNNLYESSCDEVDVFKGLM